MGSRDLSLAQQLKISCMSLGIRVTKAAEDRLSDGGRVPLSIHEYATTGGVTLDLGDGFYVNAPFDEWYCDHPEAALDVRPDGDGYEAHFRGECLPCRVLPLPGYLQTRDACGRLVRETVMSHADRARLSPIDGCSFNCQFCDTAVKKTYVPRPAEQLLAALEVAKADPVLPVRHAMISGGTPSVRDYGYFDALCEQVIRSAGMPVDVMMWPRPDDIIDKLADWGVYGYAFNLEIFDDEAAARLIPEKRRFGIAVYARGIERAAQRSGGGGRVRSLILVGLEPEEKTVAGVEFLAKLGCDPALSPFRPARGTRFENVRPPAPDALERIYLQSQEIVERYGVRLGPRCEPCQHNTLTFPAHC